MSYAKKSWQEEDIDAIQRCPHDQDNPYAQISNDLIRDQSISPNCRWLIIYLLANKGTWKIKISQIREHVSGHIGRNKLFQIVNEAIEAGYILREEYTYKNLKRCRYFISEKPKFKKCYRCPENGDTEGGDAQNQHDKEDNHKKEHKKKEYSKSSSSEEMQVAPADDDSGKNIGENIWYRRTSGQMKRITQSDIYLHFIKLPFSTETVNESISRFRLLTSPINTPLKYLESICVTIDKEKENKSSKDHKTAIKNPLQETEKIKEDTITFGEYKKCLLKKNPSPSEKT